MSLPNASNPRGTEPTFTADPALLPADNINETATLPPRAAESVTLAPGAPPAGSERVAVPGYEILGELGRGGMGVVYRARHLGLNRIVALKMILAGGHAGPDELTRFRGEAEAVARLNHPNIVQVHDVGESGGLPYFSLEFVEGGSLDRKLNGTPLAADEAAKLVETLARAMAAAHAAGLVHRDLKPANVLLTGDGTPKVTDFGLAKKLDTAGQTASGAVMGTPSYMAPEQAGGKSAEIGPGCDVYALGAILYECLTGRPPFKAATPLDTMMQVVSAEPVPPTQLQPSLPRDLETICLKCLQKEPARRYAGAATMADELRRFRDGLPIQARPVGSLERVAKWVRRRPTAAATAALLALLVLAAAVGLPVMFFLWLRAEISQVQAAADRMRAVEAQKEAENRYQEALQAKQDLETARKRERQLLEQQLASANRELARRNLRFLTVAMHAYADADKEQRLPPAALCDVQGHPLLSWRVALLPHLGVEGKALYHRFHLDEPWDSPHNRTLLSAIPDVYTPATGTLPQKHLTFYRVFTGPETPFQGPLGPRIPSSFPDGTSNTFLVVEAGEPVPWTKPDELTYAGNRPLPKLGGLLPDGFHASLADGRVVFVLRETDEAVIRAYVTPNGGELLQLKQP
jgi:Protein kinase domain/Protein of unknown function (DUF1559)